jgi:hypothetical protein
MYKELIQIKQILRVPYLYMKYKNAKFSEFKDLDICKFTPRRKKRVRNRSLDIDKIIKFDDILNVDRLS